MDFFRFPSHFFIKSTDDFFGGDFCQFIGFFDIIVKGARFKRDGKDAHKPLAISFRLPSAFLALAGQEFIRSGSMTYSVEQFYGDFKGIFSMEDIIAEVVNLMALFIHYIIILQRMLPDLVVSIFHSFLGSFNSFI